MHRIQVYAGHVDGPHDDNTRPASAKDHGYVEARDVHEVLRQIGLEFKTADYFTERQVIIVIDPQVEAELPLLVTQKMHELADALQGRS
jgi:hypothetical protein